MRHLRFLASLALTLLAALPIKAQTENEAFYIYQNDGHFDGFFYDEIVKMNFSFLDTLGIEHDEIVSQEIVTPDSTYRIMLSAIDSIGFVQPEVIFNPRLRVITYMEGTQREFIEDTWPLTFSSDEIRIKHDGPSWLPKLRADLYPQPGDVFINFDLEKGWSAKVISVKEESVNGSNYVVAQCKPIDDITDIFQQYVSVEEYRHDDAGHLKSRRVAGRPDLNIGKIRKRAFDELDYNLLNFTLNGHIPVYSKDDNIITIDPVIEGKVDVRIVYDLSFWGSKYIGITTDVNLGGSLGLSIDGKLSEIATGGVSQLGQLPIPAPAPIISFLFGPDAFTRAEGHFRASVSSPKFNTKFWLKFEIKDWIPSFDWGPGSSKDDKNVENNNQMAASFEINGFAQAGVAFPLQLQSLPVIGKLFSADIGGTWYVGPKFSGDVSVDLLNAIAGDNDAYGNLKDTKITLSPIDFDYEITANVSSLLSPKKKWTLADGTFSPAPTLDLKLFPDFEDGKWQDHVYSYGKNQNSIEDIYSFKPQGNLIIPMGVGVACYYLDEKEVEGAPKTTEKLVDYQIRSSKYWFNFLESSDFDTALKIEGGELRKRVTESDEWKTGDFKFYPIVQIWNSNQISDRPEFGDLITLPDYNETTGLPSGIIRAKPGFKIHVDKMYEVSCDTIYVNYDGTVTNPVTITDPAKEKEGLQYSPGKLDLQPTYLGFPDWFVLTGEEGKFELSVDQEKFLEHFGKYHSLVDTVNYNYNEGIRYRAILRYLDHEVEDNRYPRIHVARLPNGKDSPDSVSFWSKELGVNTLQCSTTIENNVRHCIAEYNNDNDIFRLSFDMVENGAYWSGKIHYKIKNMHIYAYSSLGDKEYDKAEGTIGEFEVEGGDIAGIKFVSIPCQITTTSKREDGTTTGKISEIFFYEFYIDF